MPNRTQPEFWNHDVALNSLSRDAELMFRKLDLFRQDDHRFPIIPSPQLPSNLHAALYYLRRGVRLTDVARWLDEIQKAGAIVVRDSERGWYGEIVERLRYCAEDFAKGAPRCGPRKAMPEKAEQGFLPLPPMGLVPAVPMPGEKSKRYDSDYGNGNDPNRAPAEVRPPAAVSRAEMNRSEAAGREAGGGNPKFARTFQQITATATGKRLFEFIGVAHMVEEARERGAYWLGLLETDADVIVDLLEQGQRTKVTDERLWTGKGRAQFLSKRLKERRAA